MDVTNYLELRIAPRAVFDSLPERGERARFMLPLPNGQWKPVSWNEHADQIRAVALFLSERGLRAGERAAIFAPNRVEWMAAALGIQAAGGAMVPIYPSSTTEQAAYVLSHSDARFVFVDTAPLLARLFECIAELSAVEAFVLLDDGLDVGEALRIAQARGADPDRAAVEARVVRFSEALAIGQTAHAKDGARFERTMREVPLESPAVMLYTSGTSGPPKGVPLTHENVGVNGRDWLECNAPLVEEEMIDLLWLPMSHIFGFGEACLGNTLGWTSYMADPASVLTRLPEVKPDVLMSVPSVWEKLASGAMMVEGDEAKAAALAKSTGGRLRFCLSGGAGLKREVKELFHAQGVLLVEGYGLTEASPTLTLNRPDAFRFDSVGKPLPSVEIRLAEDGEILARGKSIFGGYHKDPAASAEALTSDGWLRTGDVGRFTEDGFLQIIDRKKDILVTAGGKNVPPANIEQRFADDPLIAHVVVFGDAKKYLVAGVWPEPTTLAARLKEEAREGVDEATLTRTLIQASIDRVNAQLASYETIKKFVLFEQPLTVEADLLTPTFKIKRKKIYQAFGERFESLYT